MSMQAAQARYDAMEPDDTNDDIYEADLDALREALSYIDCDDLDGKRYWECDRREKLIRARIAELELEQETEEQEVEA
jgi:phosphatidylserine/phosphatidylglycerophosphate/cardiolipin synthase-like enzyme